MSGEGAIIFSMPCRKNKALKRLVSASVFSEWSNEAFFRPVY